MRWRVVVVAFVAAFAPILSSAGAGESRTKRNVDSGFTVTLPPGWKVEFYLDPESLVAQPGTSHHFDDQDGCTRRDFTGVKVSLVEDGSRADDLFGPRPDRMTPRSGRGVVSGYDDQVCDTRNQSITFADGGRRLGAHLTFGRDADERRIDEAYEVLNSLRVRTPGPSPWASFCAAGQSLAQGGPGLRSVDLQSVPGLENQIEALRRAAPERLVRAALETVAPVVVDPAATIEQIRAVDRDLDLVGEALSRHCDKPGTVFSLLLRLRSNEATR